MISPWQLSTWYMIHSWISHRNFKVDIKNANRSLFPTNLPFMIPPLKFSFISVSDTTRTHSYWKLRSHLWVFPFPDSRHSVHHQGHVPDVFQILLLCFIILVWVIITSHLVIRGFRIVSLSVFLFPPPHPPILQHNILLYFVFTSLSTSYPPLF